jgi:hypothetical protein
MPFKLSFSQLNALKSLPCSELEFNKYHGRGVIKVLWDNDLIEKDEYDGRTTIAANRNGLIFLEANDNGEV